MNDLYINLSQISQISHYSISNIEKINSYIDMKTPLIYLIYLSAFQEKVND